MPSTGHRAARPALNGKPGGDFGASPGAIGTAVAQYEQRRYLAVLNALVLNTPSVMIGQPRQSSTSRAG